MPYPNLPSLADFARLVEAADPDADHRRPLLDQAARVLYEGDPLDPEPREMLADRLERWRYQILNNRGADLPPVTKELTDTLDEAAAVVRGCPRPPRNPRAAIRAAADTLETDLRECLDPRRPLEPIARRATERTRAHFSNGSSRHRVLLYAPLYVSNYCVNRCLYCAFRFTHALEREHLSPEQVRDQAAILRDRGFHHILLVAGDFPKLTSPAYFAELIGPLAAQDFHIAVEIAPQSTAAYAQLVRAGACGVTLYQETYQEALYARYHPHGTKVWFDWRLEALERAAEAGMTRLGLGVLLGLADPRRDLAALIAHGRYLQDRYPGVSFAFSLPRIHEAPDGFEVPYPVDDETFIRLYFALRLAFPTADLVLSTREQPALRNHLAGICITQMSAGSSTSPGGYGDTEHDPRQRQQFPVCDHRTPDQVAGWLQDQGFHVCWNLDTAEFPS